MIKTFVGPFGRVWDVVETHRGWIALDTISGAIEFAAERPNDNPGAVRTALRAYLDSRGIEWRAVPKPVDDAARARALVDYFYGP